MNPKQLMEAFCRWWRRDMGELRVARRVHVGPIVAETLVFPSQMRFVDPDDLRSLVAIVPIVADWRVGLADARVLRQCFRVVAVARRRELPYTQFEREGIGLYVPDGRMLDPGCLQTNPEFSCVSEARAPQLTYALSARLLAAMRRVIKKGEQP